MKKLNLFSILKKSNLNQEKLLFKFNNLSKNEVLIIGDFILDIYTECNALGKTSKTPTLSVKKINSKKYLGGAGLFANIISNLDTKANFLTIVGNDNNANIIKKLINKNIKLRAIIDKSRPTTSKERFWVDGYKLLQVDILENNYIDNNIESKIIKNFNLSLKNNKAVILSDSRHGMMSPNLIKNLIRLSKKQKKLIILDTQLNSSEGNLRLYNNIDIISANERELREFAKDYKLPILKLARKTFKNLKIKKFLIIKLGNEGLYLLDKKNAIFFPSIKVNAIDPIGSGDTLLAVFIICLINDFSIIESLFFSTCAASFSTTIMGTQHIKRNDLENFIKKIFIEYKL